MFVYSRLFRTSGAAGLRSYATEAVATTTESTAINYLKHPDSRKTYLINRYKYLMHDSEIVLFLHHNNLVKNEINTYRNQIKELGGDLNIIRNKLFLAYLRSENEAEPASIEAYYKNKKVKHPFARLLGGPSAIITIKSNDPSIVKKIVKFTNSTNEKLFIVGAKVENKLFDQAKINVFKELPTKEQLHGQLAGLLTVLSGAGLVQTLEAASKHLYLTLESHRKNNDPSEKIEED